MKKKEIAQTESFWNLGNSSAEDKDKRAWRHWGSRAIRRDRKSEKIVNVAVKVATVPASTLAPPPLVAVEVEMKDERKNGKNENTLTSGRK